MEQSSIITEEVETVEKPNIFDIESVTIEHSKAATKFSRPIKNSKIINQETKKRVKIR